MYDIQPLDESSEEQVYRICEQSVSHHYVGETRFRMFVPDSPRFDPELALVAVKDGAPTGFIYAEQREEDKADLILMATDENHRAQRMMGELYEKVELTLRARGVKEIAAAGGPFFSGLDLRYRTATLFLLRRLYTPRQIHYDQLMGMKNLDTDTAAREEKLGAEGVTFKRLTTDDAPVLKKMLEENFSGWMSAADRLASREDAEHSAHGAFAGDEVVAFAARDGCNFGPTGTVEAFRRRGIGSVVFFRCCADVAADGHDEMIIQAANFMFYARAFACPVIPVWRSAKDLTADPAVKKAK